MHFGALHRVILGTSELPCAPLQAPRGGRAELPWGIGAFTTQRARPSGPRAPVPCSQTPPLIPDLSLHRAVVTECWRALFFFP